VIRQRARLWLGRQYAFRHLQSVAYSNPSSKLAAEPLFKFGWWFLHRDSRCVSVFWAAQPSNCSQCEFQARGDTQLVEDVVEVLFDCIFVDLEILSYFPVRVAGHDG